MPEPNHCSICDTVQAPIHYHAENYFRGLYVWPIPSSRGRRGLRSGRRRRSRPLIIERHILRPFARQRAAHCSLVREIVATVMERGALAMAVECDVGSVRVEPWRCQHTRAVDGHALDLVDGRGIAMIDMGIALEIDADAPAVIEPDTSRASSSRLPVGSTLPNAV